MEALVYGLGLRVYGRDKLRVAIAVAVLALGVGLGLAIDLVNHAALDEFAAGLVALSGEADLTVRGPRSGIDESVLATLARLPEVAMASPVVDVEATDAAGHRFTLTGIDPMRAALVERGLVGIPGRARARAAGAAAAAGAAGAAAATAADADAAAAVGDGADADADRLALLRPDSLFVSADTLARLELSVGDRLVLQAPAGPVDMRIAGTLPASRNRPPDVIVTDIAAAQVYGAAPGRLSRIDLRARPGVSREALEQAVAAQVPAGVVVQAPGNAAASDLRISRAYRINLAVLAMVALFCGSLLIFSAQTLQVTRRRQEFALLRALGMTGRGLVRRLLTEAALLGLPGAALGVVAGYGLAKLMLTRFGGDLGAGFFRGVVPALNGDWTAAVGYFMAGVAAAVAGAWIPALEAAGAAPARGLKSGSLEDAYRSITRVWPGVALLAAALLALLFPSVEDVPLGGYAAIALILIGAVAIVPSALLAVVRAVPPSERATLAIGTAQLRGAPTAPAISLAAIVAAVSLAIAMMVMVRSFRMSFEDWLGHILPADVYVSGSGLRLMPADQDRIAALSSVAHAEFMRQDDVRLRPDRPAVALLARDIDPRRPEARLPVVSSMAISSTARTFPGILPPAWVSESVAAVYGLAAGDRVTLPIGGQRIPFAVAGVFRDYGRQQGAIVIQRSVYIALLGDRAASNAALWLRAGHGAAEVEEQLGWLGPRAEVRDTHEIRALSLSIFDRTFAITYALVAVAVVIGLAAMGANLTALILARRHEFALLRHLGMRKRDIVAMLLAQSCAVVTTGVAMGCTVGVVVGAILVFVVNRQSFHWTMELHLPLLEMMVLALGLVALALLVTAISARGALTGAVVRAVAEDW